MGTRKSIAPDSSSRAILSLASVFFLVCTWASYARWANFEYRTFDLAYYIQGLWQFLHGRFQVSVLSVPLLGNHVEPIIFLFAPLLAAFPHPVLLVVVQNAALATMGPIGYSIAKRLGLGGGQACLLAAALIITPAAGYIALHEFHPEALSAPFLLLLFQARLTNSPGRHWLWFLAVLSCKENMTLLLIGYCAVQGVIERRLTFAEMRTWYLWPMGVAVVWFLLCVRLITPSLNSGNVNYLALYSHLGTSPGNILQNALLQPQLILRALGHSITQGNLIWALLFPFFCLPLLRPRWLLVSIPVLLQHFLSWRSSEWTIYFHYSAALLALFWIGTAEAVAMITLPKSVPALLSRGIPWAIVVACAVGQILLGPAAAIVSETLDWSAEKAERVRKAAFIAQIPPDASVLAPLPYLAHLATREKLYSLHHVLKGLKTLGRSSYQPPPPPDFVLIDYRDTATFDRSAGFYHPAMRTIDGRIVPSSDRLLHDFLRRCSWVTESHNELTLFRQTPRPIAPSTSDNGAIFDLGHTQLLQISKNSNAISNQQPLEIQMVWKFEGDRDVFPWMFLGFVGHGHDKPIFLTKGLCAPEAHDGLYTETWHITPMDGLAAGDYVVEAIFTDQSRRKPTEVDDLASPSFTRLSDPVPLGIVHVLAATDRLK